MKAILRCFFVVCLVAPFTLRAQNSVSYFADTVQKGIHTKIMCAQRNGPYVYIGGQSFDTLAFVYTPSIVKMDTAGNTIWTYSLNKQIDQLENFYGGTVYGWGYIQDLVIDDSSVYAHFYGINTGVHEIWKIDQTTGDLVWRKPVATPVIIRIADNNRIAYSYNSGSGYVYELVDKATGKSTYSNVIAPAVNGKYDCHFSFDTDGSLYIIKTDSVIKYSSPTMNSQSWAIKAGSNGYISAAQPQSDGYLYFFGAASTIFSGKLNKSTGSISWITHAVYNPSVLDDFLSDFKVYNDYIYMSGEHNGFGSVFTAYHICKIDRSTGQLVWEKVYNPAWNPNPSTSVGYASVNTLDADANGNVYTSGYEQGWDNRTGVWGICKFNSAGTMVYHNTIFEGAAYNSTYNRGVFSFVMNDRVFHIGEIQRTSAIQNTTVYFVATDTSGTFSPKIKKRSVAGLQEFSDVLEIKNLSASKFAVLKQIGNSVGVELRNAKDNSVLWSKTFARRTHFTADKMCVTADNKIVFSGYVHSSYQMQFDYKAIPDSIYFLKLDSTGLALSEKKYYIGNHTDFKSIHLYASADTNTVFVFSEVDYYGHDNSIHFFNIDRAVGSIGDFSNYFSSIYTPLVARQALLVPLSKDSTIHMQNYMPGYAGNKTIYNALTFKNNTGGGYASVAFAVLSFNVIVHNMAVCDSASVIVLSKDYSSGNYVTMRFNPRAHTAIWSKTDPSSIPITMASCSKKQVYLLGTSGANLLIRQLNITDGTQNWEKQVSPPLAKQYFVPINQKYNALRNQYTITGYVADTSGIMTTQSVFYLTIDSSGNIVAQWIQKGDYNLKNSLKAIEISQYGQTLIGGALYKYPYGRSGVLITADTAIIEKVPAVPAIIVNPSDNICNGDSVTLTASSAGCSSCVYSWSTTPVITQPVLVVKASGTYTVTATNTAGSSSAGKTVTVNPIPPKPSIAQTGNTLSSSAASGNQWYRDGVIIPGATGQLYVPANSANYSVKVTVNGCTGMESDKFNFVITGVINIDNTHFVKLSPNPVKDYVMLSFNVSGYTALNVEIVDMQGNLVASFRAVTSDTRLNLPGLATGLYIVKIYAGNGKLNYTMKLVR